MEQRHTYLPDTLHVCLIRPSTKKIQPLWRTQKKLTGESVKIFSHQPSCRRIIMKNQPFYSPTEISYTLVPDMVGAVPSGKDTLLTCFYKRFQLRPSPTVSAAYDSSKTAISGRLFHRGRVSRPVPSPLVTNSCILPQGYRPCTYWGNHP